MNLGFEIQTTNLEIRISILETPCVPIFRQNGQLYLFSQKFVQKGIGKIELEIHETNVAKKISILEIPFLSIFRQNAQL